METLKVFEENVNLNFKKGFEEFINSNPELRKFSDEIFNEINIGSSESLEKTNNGPDEDER